MPLYERRRVASLPRLGHRSLELVYPYDDYVEEPLEDEEDEFELEDEEDEGVEDLPHRFVTAGRTREEPAEPYLPRPPRWRPGFRLRHNPVVDPDAAEAVLHDLLWTLGERDPYHAIKNHPEQAATIYALAREAQALEVIIYKSLSEIPSQGRYDVWVLVVDGDFGRIARPNIRSRLIYERHLVARRVYSSQLYVTLADYYERARQLKRQIEAQLRGER